MKSVVRALCAAVVVCSHAALVPLASAQTVASSRGQAASLLMPTPASARFDADSPTVFGRISTALPQDAGPILRSASLRLVQRLHAMAAPQSAVASALALLQVQVICVCARGSGLALHGDESSTIRLTKRGAEIRANTEVGVLRAFATITQLAQPAVDGFTLPTGEITDRPRFPWRGLMIDVARHFQSVAAIKRQIDAMELVKLNVLHLHLSDNEGFRLESRRFPKLHTIASNGEYYTQAQIRELVAYAANRGVRVVPEIDLPGHSRAITAAYPFLSSDTTGARTAEIDPTRESTYAFVSDLLTEVATLFPDPYLHVGADEVNAAQWNRNPAIQRYMRANNLPNAHALQARFTTRVHGIVQRLGKTMIGWDEILAPDLPSSVVVQSWRSSTQSARAAQHGHQVIVSAGNYLDWLTPSDSLHRMDPFDMRAFGLAASDRDVLRGTRLETAIPEGFVTDLQARLTADDERKILGGEAAMWTELVTEEKLDATIWPRTAAVADQLWAPRGTVTAPLDERIAAVAAGLERIGLQHRRSPVAMRRRLAPEGGEPLEVIAQALEPVKFYAHNHKARGQGSPPQQFTALADALSPESATAVRFNRLAREWSPSARGAGDELRALLVQWRDQQAAMETLIDRYPALADAREASRDLAVLAGGALDAMDQIERGTLPSAQWRARLQPVLDRQASYVTAAKNFVQSFVTPQPPGDLLLAPLAGLRRLIEAASERRPQP